MSVCLLVCVCPEGRRPLIGDCAAAVFNMIKRHLFLSCPHLHIIISSPSLPPLSHPSLPPPNTHTQHLWGREREKEREMCKRARATPGIAHITAYKEIFRRCEARTSGSEGDHSLVNQKGAASLKRAFVIWRYHYFGVVLIRQLSRATGSYWIVCNPPPVTWQNNRQIHFLAGCPVSQQKEALDRGWDAAACGVRLSYWMDRPQALI